MKLEPAVERWAAPGWLSDGPTINIIVEANKIYYMPIFVSKKTTFIRIGINVEVGGAGTADLRIFTQKNGVPDALILSAGTVDTSTPGLKEIVINQELVRGYYFLAIRCSATPKISGIEEMEHNAPMAGFGATLSGDFNNIVLTHAAAYSDPAGVVDGYKTSQYAFLRLREN